jgi:serine/threonine protein kinase
VEPVLQALAYMHNKGILHRDIKPENLLIAKEGGDEVVKIADFGLCIDSLEERPTSRVGTVEYMAPEVAVRTSRNGDGSPGNPRRPYGVSADVWSVGVLIHELLTGVTPSDVAQPGGGCKTPVSTDGMSRPEYVSESAWDLISSCLRNAACDRPSVSQLLRHPLITGETFVPARSKIGSLNLAQSDVSYSLSPKPPMKHRPGAARLAVTGTEDGDSGSASRNKTKGISMRVGRQSLSKYSGDEQELASMIMRKMQLQEAAAAQEQLKPAQHQAVQRRGSWVAAKPSAKAIERENRRRSCLMPRNMTVVKDSEEAAAIVMEPGRRRGFGPRDETSTGELLPSRPTTPKSLRQWSFNNSSSSSDLYDEALERGFAAAESADPALLSPSQKPKLPPLKLPPSPVARTSSPHSPGTPSKRLPASLTQLADDRSSSPSLLRRPKMLDSAFRYPELPTTRKELF